MKQLFPVFLLFLLIRTVLATVSIDVEDGTSTGASEADQSLTISKTVASNSPRLAAVACAVDLSADSILDVQFNNDVFAEETGASIIGNSGQAQLWWMATPDVATANFECNVNDPGAKVGMFVWVWYGDVDTTTPFRDVDEEKSDVSDNSTATLTLTGLTNGDLVYSCVMFHRSGGNSTGDVVAGSGLMEIEQLDLQSAFSGNKPFSCGKKTADASSEDTSWTTTVSDNGYSHIAFAVKNTASAAELPASHQYYR